MLSRLAIPLIAFSLFGLFSSSSRAEIIFNFTYEDVGTDSDFGFDDPILGATRRATVEAVASYINTVVDHDGRVDIGWDVSVDAPGSSTLASMGTSYFLNQGVSQGFVFEHATTGQDPLAGLNDGSGDVNFGRTWNSGLAAPASNEFDLFSVVLHELTHAMGFASLIAEDGGFRISGTRSVYDTFLEDAGGEALIEVDGDFVNGQLADLTSEDLFLDLGDGLPRLEAFAPTDFQPGSSLSHIDFSEDPGNDVVMVPGIAAGVTKRTYSQQDLRVLRAIGWNVVAVPEPSGLLLLGCSSFALLTRRSRSNG